jgi:hypothetical protein
MAPLKYHHVQIVPNKDWMSHLFYNPNRHDKAFYAIIKGLVKSISSCVFPLIESSEEGMCIFY